MSTFDDEFDRIDRDTRDEPKEEPERQEAKPPTARTLKKRAAYAREWRQRQREAAKAKLASLTPADIWARNRAQLSPEQIADLTARQFEWAGLALAASRIVEALPLPKTKYLKMGPQPDGTDGLPFPDELYRECSAYNREVNPHGYVIPSFSPVEFVQLHEEGVEDVLRLFTERDPEYIKWGFRVRFRTQEWNGFVNAVARYLQSHPDDENFDPTIATEVEAEWASRQRSRFQKPAAGHTNVTPEDAQRAAELRLQGELKKAVGGLLEERKWNRNRLKSV
jgi:hypothetical protein